MRVTPVTKEVADAGGMGEMFPPGDYDFIVYAAEEALSKAGNEMLKLTLHVFNRDGEKRTVFDYILSSESGAWKARHMMESINMLRRYDLGIIDPREIEGKPGRCKLRIKPAKGDFPAGNEVADYLGMRPIDAVNTAPRARQTAATVPQWDAPKGGDLDDEIPF